MRPATNSLIAAIAVAHSLTLATHNNWRFAALAARHSVGHRSTAIIEGVLATDRSAALRSLTAERRTHADDQFLPLATGSFLASHPAMLVS